MIVHVVEQLILLDLFLQFGFHSIITSIASKIYLSMHSTFTAIQSILIYCNVYVSLHEMWWPKLAGRLKLYSLNFPIQ